MHNFDPLLSDRDLERITGRSRSSWQKDRLTGGGIPFIRVGRLVRADAGEGVAEIMKAEIVQARHAPDHLPGPLDGH